MSGPFASEAFKTLTLERLQVGAAHTLSAAMLHECELSVIEDVVYGGLVARLSSYVLADKLADETHTATKLSSPRPASFWQHTKQVHFPTLSRWLRRPPRMTQDVATLTVNVRSFATFPESTVVYPKELGRVVRLQMLDSSWSGWGES